MEVERPTLGPMKTLTATILVMASALRLAGADETAVTPQLESIGLFKNGLAVVRATFPVSGPGSYRWDKVPQVVHGSFWVESDGLVSVRSTSRLINETPEVEQPVGELQGDLAGKQVRVTMKATEGAVQVVSGRVWEVPFTMGNRNWDTNYTTLTPGSRNRYGYYPQPSNIVTRPASTFLVIEQDGGKRCYIQGANIASVEVEGPFGPVTRKVERPVLVFDVRKVPSQGGVVRVSYLTKGLAWLPAYQVDLSDAGKLKIRQSAVVRNEMQDLDGSELQLISGYPNVRFGGVDSPLLPTTGLAAFFQQVNASGSASGASLTSNMMSQQIAYNSYARAPEAPTLPEVAESGNVSDDIHYESIGKHDLKLGDSLSLDIAAAEAGYERVVDWTVADPRGTNGRYRNRDAVRDEDHEPWDAVRFTNPFKFPMTTAPALVMENGRFRGQSLSQWVNPEQSTCLRITRALSVRAESREVEEEGQREIVYIAGNDYQKTEVKGRLTLHNYRGKEVTMNITCEFSGKMIEAEMDPESMLRAEGVYSVNPRRQLKWNVKVPAGGKKELTYRYEVLVDR